MNAPQWIKVEEVNCKQSHTVSIQKVCLGYLLFISWLFLNFWHLKYHLINLRNYFSSFLKWNLWKCKHCHTSKIWNNHCLHKPYKKSESADQIILCSSKQFMLMLYENTTLMLIHHKKIANFVTIPWNTFRF